jgi:hypothetical protein
MRRSAAGALLALLLAACEPAPDATAPEPAPSEPPAVAAEPGSPPFLAPAAVLAATGEGEVATAVDLRAASHPGFDRLVLELDRAAGYRVAWLDGPPVGCGSGEVVELPGAAFLEIRLEPAKAHDEEGALTLQTRDLRPELPALSSVAVTCDFEAVLTLAAGAPRRLPFRVARLEAPPRLVVDVARSDGATP